jgi:hypothetical protein
MLSDDHFVFGVSPITSVAATSDAEMGAGAYVNQAGMKLLEFDATNGQLVHASGLGRTALFDRNPFVATGAGGLVAVAGTASTNSFPLAGSLAPYYPQDPFPQLTVQQFGDTAPTPQTVTVWGLSPNAGATAGNVQFPLLRRPLSVSTAAPSTPSWLVVYPQAFSVPGSVQWQISPAGLAPGRYAATVPVVGNGGSVLPAAIQFLMIVDALQPVPAQIAASANQGQTAYATIQLPAVGGLAFTVSSDQPWLQADLAAAVSPAAISLQMPTSSLVSGSYTGNIKLTPNGVASDAVVVPVTLTVN